MDWLTKRILTPLLDYELIDCYEERGKLIIGAVTAMVSFATSILEIPGSFRLCLSDNIYRDVMNQHSMKIVWDTTGETVLEGLLGIDRIESVSVMEVGHNIISLEEARNDKTALAAPNEWTYGGRYERN